MTDKKQEEGRDEEDGRFLPGNRFWEVRSSAGPKPKFDSPEKLQKCCIEYFEWNEANPLWEMKAFANGTTAKVQKMRAMTLGGLFLFLGIDKSTWSLWRNKDSDIYRPDLLNVIKRAEEIIRTQKFEGASADLLNANIIARDLGLADKVNSQHTGEGGGPIQTASVTIGADDDPAEALKKFEMFRRGLNAQE